MAKASITIRIVVCGEKGTGKSSLIATVSADNFPANVPPVLPPTTLPEDFYPDGVPTTIIDAPSRKEDRCKLGKELKRADAVVITYAGDRPETLDKLSTFWLPELRRLEVKVPIIVVGCKLDLRDDNHQQSFEEMVMPIMLQFKEIETWIECSALEQIGILEVFYNAQKAVLHPSGPLFDDETGALKHWCLGALVRIFILCDNDKDGALSDAELSDFQVKCFNNPLQPADVVGIKRTVQERIEGVDERGVTLLGFLCLHEILLEKWSIETIWTILRKFGYDNDMELADSDQMERLLTSLVTEVEWRAKRDSQTDSSVYLTERLKGFVVEKLMKLRDSTAALLRVIPLGLSLDNQRSVEPAPDATEAGSLRVVNQGT